MHGARSSIAKCALGALPRKKISQSILAYSGGGGSFCDCFHHFSPNSEINRHRQLGGEIQSRQRMRPLCPWGRSDRLKGHRDVAVSINLFLEK